MLKINNNKKRYIHIYMNENTVGTCHSIIRPYNQKKKKKKRVQKKKVLFTLLN